MSDGPLFAYRRRVADGLLRPDPGQELLAEKLQSLHRALDGFQPSAGHAGWKARFGLTRRRAEPPQGVYIYGGVGSGKSMLMDLFFESAPLDAKRRVHFHEFMQDVHAGLHEMTEDGDPIPGLARRIAEGAALLCFDELQVDAIVDAMILGRLFEALFALDVVIVATSNRPPTDLYKDGLRRQSFLPFIDLICAKLDILELSGGVDYRLERLRGMKVYHQPLGRAADEALAGCFSELSGGLRAAPERLRVKGREIDIAAAAAGVARSDFRALCAKPLGAGDYLAIAARYHTLILSDIPRLAPEKRNEARRFVHLIDALYEKRVNLICSAEAPPAELYEKGKGVFEFERLVSRLMEMQSRDYLAAAHLR